MAVGFVVGLAVGLAVGLVVGLAVGWEVVGLLVDGGVLGAAVGARVRQMVYPGLSIELSVCQVKVWPWLTATLTGPVVPQYFWLPIWILSWAQLS